MLLNDAETKRAAMPRVPPEHPPMIVDVAIVGAGIAGLWLANLLTGRGLAVALCAGGPVGGAQTAASQGIVHSGIKYGSGRSAVLAGMPARWRACLAGRGEVDLRGVEVPAEHIHLHGSGAAGFVLARGAKRVAAGAGSPFGPGLLFALPDFAVDVPSLIRTLAEPVRHRLVAARIAPDDMVRGPMGVDHMRVGGRTLRAGAYVLAAGVGNAALAERVGARAGAMRRRPLRQTCVYPQADAPRLFAHCVGGGRGAAPALTVTSHAGALYIGGKVADEGAGRGDAHHLAALRRLLAEHLPALNLTGAVFESVLVDRAEPAADSARNDGDAFVARHDNCLVCWPIKMSLAPRLGDKVLDALRHLRPVARPWPGDAANALAFATPPWAARPAAGAGECRPRQQGRC